MPTRRPVNKNKARPIPTGFITPKSLGDKKPIMYTAAGASVAAVPSVSSAATSNTPPTPSQANPSVSSTGSLNGGLNYSEAVPGETGSLADFQKVMRAISQDAYESRAKAEGKITDKQFDRTKVSGSIFRSIMDNLEGNRGQDVSKIYAGAVEAAEFDLKQKEEQRQFNIKEGAESSVSSGFGVGDGYRTDRHNNPIAAAVKFGGKNQFTDALDKAGISWSYGDTFPEDKTMSTIRILGDPIEASRVILGTTNAIQGWYVNSSSGGVLRQMGVTNNEQFAKLPKEQQDQIIVGIYKGEVGNGSLVSSLLPKDPEIESYARNIQAGKATMTNVPAKLRGDVSIELDRIGKEEFNQTAQVATDAYDLATELINHEGLEGATGFWRVPGAIAGTDARDFVVKANSLKDKILLDILASNVMKGALSDRDIQVLSSAASVLSDRTIKEETYRTELEKVRSILKKKIDYLGVKVDKESKEQQEKASSLREKYGY